MRFLSMIRIDEKAGQRPSERDWKRDQHKLLKTRSRGD